MVSTDFCNRLEELCRVRHWSCADLARLTDLCDRSCSDYLRGVTPPSYKFLVGLHGAGVDVGALLTGQTRHADALVSLEAVIGQAAQYKATLDAISAVLTTRQPQAVAASTPEEVALLHAFRTANPSQRSLFKAIYELQNEVSGQALGTAP